MQTFHSYLNFPTLLYKAIFKTVQPVHQCIGFQTEFVNQYVNIRHYNRFNRMFKSVDDVPSFAFIAAFKSLVQTLAISPIPSKLLGLVHIGFQLKNHNGINWLLPFTVTNTITDVTESEKGVLYSMETIFSQAQQPRLSMTNHFLAKNSDYKGNRNIQHKTINIGKELTAYQVNQMKAWQYAMVSGDVNPIHLGKPFAKVLGLKNSIIHGMYHVHCLLSTVTQDKKSFKNIDVQFKKPCLIPAKVKICVGEHEKYYVCDYYQEKLYLSVEINKSEE